ncbi:hypothetical protein D0N50_22780 (plasmid) [Erwinia billingiae]|nr:hypothetical protein D0N50_22780 [Erwinia billingiae]
MLRTEPAGRLCPCPFRAGGFPSTDATPAASRGLALFTGRAAAAEDATPFRRVGCVHARWSVRLHISR